MKPTLMADRKLAAASGVVAKGLRLMVDMIKEIPCLD